MLYQIFNVVISIAYSIMAISLFVAFAVMTIDGMTPPHVLFLRLFGYGDLAKKAMARWEEFRFGRLETFRQLVTYSFMFGGAVGVGRAVTNWTAVFDIINQIKLPALEIAIVTSAFAAQAKSGELGPFIPYFLAALLGMMMVAFLSSVVVVLTVGGSENTARRRSADNLVKTLGGFFAGFGMALLRY